MRLLGCLLLWLASAAALAHEVSVAELEVRETAAGEYVWAWLGVPDPVRGDLRAVWPPQCAEQARMLHCGQQGLSGTLGVEGVGRTHAAAVVRIRWRDGRDSLLTLTGREPRGQVAGPAGDRRDAGEIIRAYLELGVEHIAGGLDHLAFVMALMLWVGFERRLVLTLTAFTLGHSLTLGLSAVGWLTLRSAPVEAAIALSIMLVANEALRGGNVPVRHRPAGVAALFGLVHGLGFAGALADIGLPRGHLLAALASFNAGVEAGQLALVGLAWVLSRLLRHVTLLRSVRTPALYLIGSVAAGWSVERIGSLLMA